MPRTLPWLTSTSNNSKTPSTKPGTTHSSHHAPPRKRLRLAPPPSSTSPAREHTRHASDRTPSTSPPPPLPPPPAQEPMRPGDEAWIMVEDEFHATAQLFTQALHRAEYVKLKQAAAQRRAGLARTVDGRVKVAIEDGKRRGRADAAVARAKEKVGNGEVVEDADEEEVLIVDKNLRGLMSDAAASTRVGKARLAPLAGSVQSKTRAAAGFKQRSARPETSSSSKGFDASRAGIYGDITGQRHDRSDSNVVATRLGDSSDDGDLDAPVAGSHQHTKPPELDARTARHTHSFLDTAKPNMKHKYPSPPQSAEETSGTSPRKPSRPPEAQAKKAYLFDDIPQPRISLEMLAKRRKAREKAQKQKLIRAEEIPTFLVQS